ncbi:sodium:glutamate symporter [Stieleria sp. TO1_6]|uniref:sodium/glutamate symporter n=1 Tax=Stieleria tagensis TaxID=2956795 RepID=UPI00209AFC99|nr:sodium/glutamate symporter [Stieleria tagensis]MCO8123797.1 sodium:glutamate symporter [Stieleria tagensis]
MSLAFLFVAVLLLAGVVVRQRLRVLQHLFIPGCVVAGFIGLLVVTLADRLGSESVAQTSATINETLAGWPGPLIAVVFAAMMLQPPAGSAGSNDDRQNDETTAGSVGRQGLMVWIIVLGETMVGLLATWLLIQPRYDVPNSFGMLIETGFAGGHGTAAAMGQVFSSPQVGLDAGLDLGLLMATCGLVYGVVSGIVWINVGARLGWLKSAETADLKSTVKSDQRKPIGFQTLTSDAIDPLLLQVVWIALAVAAGMLLQSAVMSIAGFIDTSLGIGSTDGSDAARKELSKRLSASNVLDFPLFIYSMFGGWLVRWGLHQMGQSQRIDSATIQRLSSTAMEILVVAAITSLKPSAVAQLLGPFLILFVCGAIWTAFCLLVISRWVLPREHWFELGLINYGMSTGTTATGFVLLRVVDPELRTAAASDYALAAPLSAPFIGGGILTIALPLVLLEQVSIVWPATVITVIVVALVVLGRRIGRDVSLPVLGDS